VIVGSGIDVIEIARIERALARSGDRFARRVFAPEEIECCRGRRRPGPHFAICFAVKEAVMKALGTGWSAGVRWVDIETVTRERGVGNGRPGVPGGLGRPGEPGGKGALGVELAVALHGGAAERARALGSAQPHLAVSRTRSHAVALVLLESADSAPERGGR